MQFDSITVCNHRLFAEKRFFFNPNVNFIVGSNATGKTSILEALYLVSSGSSFRTRSLKQIVNFHCRKESLGIKAYVRDEHNSPAVASVFLQGSNKQLYYREQQVSAKEMILQMPVKLYLGKDLTEFKSPMKKRKILDWLCYYCCPEFHLSYLRYHQLLKNYNKSISCNFSHAYNQSLIEPLTSYANKIDSDRKKMIRWLTPQLQNITQQKINIHYDRGWKGDFSSCCHPCHTLCQGPHLYNLSFYLNGNNIQHYSSRGQLKAFIYSLYMAQTLTLRDNANINAIHIIDDFTAELGHLYCSRLLNKLETLKMQVIITSLQQPSRQYNTITL